jgi:crossover junction endodeoxyribonuclease RuvC
MSKTSTIILEIPGGLRGRGIEGSPWFTSVSTLDWRIPVVGVIETRGQSIRSTVYHGVIQYQGWWIPQALRLLAIKESLVQVLEAYKPQAASVETLYFAKNVGSALPVSEARGATLLCLADWGIPVFEYTPLVIKQTVVGRGEG